MYTLIGISALNFVSSPTVSVSHVASHRQLLLKINDFQSLAAVNHPSVWTPLYSVREKLGIAGSNEWQWVMSIFFPPAVNGVPWSSENPRRNSHTFNCRMLVNPHSEAEETQDHEAQQKYETMQCFAVSEPKSIKEEGEGEPRFLKTHLSHMNYTETLGLMLQSGAGGFSQANWLFLFH